MIGKSHDRHLKRLVRYIFYKKIMSLDARGKRQIYQRGVKSGVGHYCLFAEDERICHYGSDTQK